MPWSMWDNILPIMNEVHRLQPKRVCDCGVGFGKYGVLVREILDGMYGRCRNQQWQAEIIGVEAWSGYRNPAWGCYDDVRIEDFAERRPEGYDLVLMIDSLEHLPKETGRAVLADIVARNKRVIVSVPVGISEQGEVHGNPYEAHRTQFDGTEFEQYSPAVLHQSYCRVYSIPGALQ